MFVCVDAVKCHELFINFGEKSFVSDIICKYLSQSVCCLFVLVIVPFAVQKPLGRSHLIIFAFISISLGD